MQTLIVGAGPTGFGAAWAAQRQGRDFQIIEAGDAPGGAAASHRQDGFSWDFGGHVIHSHFSDFDDALAASATPMRQVVRSGTVLVEDNFVDTPYQQQLSVLPTDIRPGADADHLGDYLRNEMGALLYDEFFAPFNEKMWAHPLHAIDHRWTSLRSGSGASNVPQVSLKKPSRPFEEFPYPSFGSGDVWDRIAALFPGRQTFNRRLVAVDLDQHIATFDSGEPIHYGELISTVPLDKFTQMVSDERLATLGAGLVHTQARILGLGFRGEIAPKLADKTYIYSPDLSLGWHRASVLSNYSPDNAPAGHWSILFEASTSDHRPITAAHIKESAYATLKQLGVDTDLCVSTWETYLEYGYPIPTLDRDVHLREIHSALEAHDVRSRGRFGGWRYESCNQDYSFAQGVEAIDSPYQADVLWHPEKF
jgi:protoporphyrinogen oxidase